ncbi:hypothetical protein EIN_141390 [Entamoeba invadens IP1]|uniref:Leucine rich repeat containing protein BspA family protein n=1 Tax=Entamoeba invadens IP1 TaxID=370355 RepID=A0A0A1UHG7_ENTIV|nr:hypothetical protein EIN_141390 [Entamoeba invadens IP1]ELP95297.1 hypothetical protein EIN_141390 [Entamoeba invadens IP1]|eukprot:XP_004262068.1 hypothetical protein EIN_141390 [Entamoeba invadens IP1]
MQHIYGLEHVHDVYYKGFYNCCLLEELVLDDYTTVIENNLSGLTSLTKLVLPNDNMKIRYTPTSEETPILEKFGYTYDSVLYYFDSYNNHDMSDFKDVEKCKHPVEIFGNQCIQDIQTKITVPSNVTKISDNFFKSVNIEEVDLGAVCDIGDNFFGPSLVSVTLPTTLTHIGDYIFENCDKLKNVDLCGKLTFSGLVSVTEMVRLSRLNIKCSNVCLPRDMVSKYNFGNDLKISLTYSNKTSSLSSFVVPQNVERILRCAFCSCSNLSEIQFSSNLTSIEDDAFSDCISLREVQFPACLRRIGSAAFKRCGLTEITIPQSVTQIGDNVFYNNFLLQRATVPLILLNSSAVFCGCHSLKTVEVTQSIITDDFKRVKKVGKSLFSECFSLSEFEVPEGVEYIESFAFSRCSSLSKILIGKSVAKIQENCFEKCDSLSDIEIPSTVTYIGDFAFKECAKLERVKFTKIPLKMFSTVFDGCEQLKNIFIENQKIDEIEFAVSFSVSQSLKKNLVVCKRVVFEQNDVEKHLEIVKENKKSVGSVPDGVTELGDQCFRNYKKVNIIRVPKSVKKVGDFCFYKSLGVKNIKFEDKRSVKFSELAFGEK